MKISLILHHIKAVCRKAAGFLKTVGAAVGLPVDSAVNPGITTVGDVIAVHNAFELELSDPTRRAHQRALLKMVATVARHRCGLDPVDHRGSHLPALADDPLVATFPLAGLDEQFIRDYIAACSQHLAPTSPEWFAACATSASRMSKVKAMFSPAVLAAYRKAGLNVPPNIAGFSLVQHSGRGARDRALCRGRFRSWVVGAIQRLSRCS